MIELELLNCGKVAILDDADYDRLKDYHYLGKESANGHWYAVRSIHYGPGKKKLFYLQRDVLRLPRNGKIKVDFVDKKNTLNCCRSNLRKGTEATIQRHAYLNRIAKAKA